MLRRGWVYAGLAVVVCVGGAAWYGSGRAVSGAPQATTVSPVSAVASAVQPPPVTGAGSSRPPPVAAVAPAPDARFQLLRVAIPPVAEQNAAAEASISVDGLAPKIFRVGDAVVGAVVLQSVQPNAATLGPAGGPAAVVLSLAPPGTTRRASAGSDTPSAIRPASAPAVNRSAVPVSDPNHGEDTSNH